MSIHIAQRFLFQIRKKAGGLTRLQVPACTNTTTKLRRTTTGRILLWQSHINYCRYAAGLYDRHIKLPYVYNWHELFIVAKYNLKNPETYLHFQEDPAGQVDPEDRGCRCFRNCQVVLSVRSVPSLRVLRPVPLLLALRRCPLCPALQACLNA